MLLLLAGVVLASIPATSASTLSTAGTTPGFVSSGLPYVFANETFSLVLSTTEAANWSCVLCPYGSLLYSDPSFSAALSDTLPWNGTHVAFSVKATMGGSPHWENWTTTVLTNSTISSLPSFSVTDGTFYAYSPTVVNPGSRGATWTFSGAPYLSLNPATGEVSGTPSNATIYTNVLTYASTLGSWTQAWVTVPTQSTFPSSLTFSAMTDAHPVTLTLPTSALASAGDNMVWLGDRPILNFGSGSDGYDLTDAGAGVYTLTWESGTTSNKTLWYFDSPGATYSASVDGHALALPVLPASGFANYTLVPPPKVTSVSVTASTSVSLTAAWTNPTMSVSPGVVGDNIHYGLACGSWSGQVNLSLSTSYTITSLAPSTRYCVGVGAVSLAGQGPLNYTNGTTAVLPPATSLSEHVYGSFVALTWSIPSPDVYTAEKVYFGGTCGNWNEAFPVTPPTAELNVSQASGSYCIGVVLFAGNYGSAPAETNATVSPINPPGEVVGVKATDIESTNVTIQWNATANATSYEVLYGLVCGFYPSRLSAGNVTHVLVTGLSPITAYCFVVQAFNGTNGGPYSATLTVTTLSSSPTNTTSSPPPITPPPNPSPYSPPTSSVTVVNYVALSLVVVGAVIVGLVYQRYQRGGRR